MHLRAKHYMPGANEFEEAKLISNNEELVWLGHKYESTNQQKNCEF